MPFGFLKRRKSGESGSGSPDKGAPGGAAPGGQPGEATPSRLHAGSVRGVPFTALTEDWRLRGRMDISGRLSDALNKREAIAITDVSWGPTDATELEPAPGLKSVDPYDLIMVTAGEDSLPPLTEGERLALKVHKVAYDVALEVPPFRVIGTVYLHPGSEPDRLLERSTEMFVAVADATAKHGEVEVTDPEVEVILVNRFYLRGVSQVDKRTGEPHQKLPGAPLGGTNWQDRS
ncbi:MAG TPA: hypothetical protein VES19_08225 [Candidatus Limnocylindrales bacterium]|nr:hypothetical protein [Candidatus Limnocylindrales bacterium]